MIRYALILLAAIVAFGAGQKPERSNTKTTTGPTPKAPPSKNTQPENVIPSGATELSPGVYKHTDNAGKTWIYRKTPFGIAKTAETGETESPRATEAAKPAERGNPFGDANKASANATTADVSAVEEGDVVKFERNTPFGPTKWTRKKTELTAYEQEILEKTRSRKNEGVDTKAGTNK